MAERKLEVRILTPAIRQEISQYKYQGEADMVIVRTITGDRGFLYGHEACSTILDSGFARIIGAGEQEIKLAVLGGVAQIDDNIITIITETAEWPEDIDRSRAIEKRDDLLNRMETAEPDALEGLKEELRAAELLVTASELPSSGMSNEK